MCNLLDEGNASFREKEWEQAAREFSEGLNVSSYAAGEDIQIPEVLLESLYVNRAAAYHSLVRALLTCDVSPQVTDRFNNTSPVDRCLVYHCTRLGKANRARDKHDTPKPDLSMSQL